VLNGNGVFASLDYDFLNGRYYQTGIQVSGSPTNFATVSRASSGTNLLPTSASGATIVTFGSNAARVTSGLGLLVEEARTNLLLNSTVPATQTTGSLNTGAYTLWVNGSGSATMSAGSGTGCGTGAASQGSAVNFTITIAGTCTVAVAGSLNAFQLELGTFGTSMIVTAGVTVARAADVVTVTTVPTFGSAYSLFAKGTPNAPTGYSQDQVYLAVDDNTGNNFARIYRGGSTGNRQVIGFAGGAQFWFLAGAALSQSTSFKSASAWAASDQAFYVGGSQVGTNASGTPAVPTFVHIGAASGGGSICNCYLERIALWPTTRLPNAALQTVTQ
jgi:hypothetical protein